MKMIIYSLAQGDTNQERRPKKPVSIMSPDRFLHIFIVCFFSLQSIFTTCIALFLFDIQRYVKKKQERNSGKQNLTLRGS